jgi:predicted ATPase/class 3 adenylate cyclase
VALASYVAPYVRRRVAADGPPALPAVDRLVGAVVLADISGFTLLSERLADAGVGGTEALSDALNRYFGAMVDFVTDQGGEVLGFAGDALLALWSSPSRRDDTALAEATRRAATWALAVGRGSGETASLTGIDLVVRLALAAGTVFGVHLGGVDGLRHSVVSGGPIERLSGASERAGPGDVVLDDVAWSLVSADARSQPLGGGFHRLDSLPPPDTPPAPPDPDSGTGDLSAYVPVQVLRQEQLGQGQWLAELRRLTVVFVTLPDFSHRADARAAQRVAAMIQEELGRHEATVNKLSVDSHGTSVLAATGLPPLSHDDDPVRGVRSALAVADGLRRLGWRGGVGVATGRVFCGPVGNAVRREYTMVGDAVNVAARLAGEARVVGGDHDVAVMCDSATYEATQHRLDYGPARTLAVTGRTSPVTLYRAAGRRPGTGAGTSRRAGFPLVGRDPERYWLVSALDHLDKGEGGVVVLEGEAGIGKSRLLAEVMGLAAERGIRWVGGVGDPVERVVAYHAWRDVFAALLGVEESATGPGRGDRIVDALPAPDRPLAPLLNPVLGIDLPNTEVTTRLAGEARLEATRELLLGVLEGAAAEPLVVLLDDAHWFDSASWSLVLDAVRRVPQLLFVLATRPVEPAAPEFAELVTEPGTDVLTVGPLAPAQAVALVCARLGATSLPPPVAELILERAGGNPLYSEELAFALRDGGFLGVSGGDVILTAGDVLPADAVPSTLEAVIGSRIDALDPPSQLALKVASVIGTTFLPKMVNQIHRVADDAAGLANAFAMLVERNLVVVDDLEPSPLYAFRHLLTRDVAYNLMLFSQRRELHRAVAEWHELRFAHDLAPLYATLGHHWAKAGLADKASGYLALASIDALNHGMPREAVDLGLEAASLLGIGIPRRTPEIAAAIGPALAAIEQRGGGRSLDDLLFLPPVGDPKVAAAIGTLLRTQPAAYMSRQDELYALMGLKNFLLTLEHGGTPFTPGVVAIYASLVRPLTGDPVRAFALSTLAKRLAERDAPPMRSYAGFVHTWLIHHWTQPIASDLPEVMEHSRLGYEHGDVMFGSFNAAAYVIHLAASGAPLDVVIETAAANRTLIAGRVASAAWHCLHELQVAKALAGLTSGPCSLSDVEGIDEERHIASISQTDSYNQIAYYFISKLRLHCYHRQYVEACAFAERAEALLPAFAGQAIEPEFVLFSALARLGSLTPGEAASPVAEAARERLRRVRAWQGYAPTNFRHKSLMIEGELAQVEGDPARAALLLAEAAESARMAGFVHHEALARELEGRARLRAGDAVGSRAALERASDGYGRWGARSKVDDVAAAVSRVEAP